MWQEAGLIGRRVAGGDLVSAPQWVISVTALGDLDGRVPVLAGRRAAWVTQWPSPASWAGLQPDITLWHNGIDGFECSAPPTFGTGTAIRSGSRCSRHGRDGDDGRFGRAGGRPEATLPRPPALGSMCPRRRWRPTTTPCPPPPPQRTLTCGPGCSAVGKSTLWSRRFPERRPDGWRVDRHGGRRSAAGAGRRRPAWHRKSRAGSHFSEQSR